MRRKARQSSSRFATVVPELVVAPDWDEMALVGRIARPHGIRGQVIVNPETDFPDDRFRPDAVMYVRRGGVVEAVTLTSVRFHQARPVIGLRGVEDVNAALSYAGADLRVPADQLLPLPAGAFYQHQLVGCEVVTRAGEPVGTVRGLEGTMETSRLVVEGPGGEVLVPFAHEICVAIDPVARRIVIEPPAGLLTLNAPDPRGSRAERREAARRAKRPPRSDGARQPDDV